MVAKLRTIVMSRFRKQREEDWVKERRVTCLECENNSLNDTSSTLAHDFLAALSYFYSWITGRAKDEGTYGSCNICGCDCFFKSLIKEEECPKGKWKE
jgi:hypothetical protein